MVVNTASGSVRETAPAEAEEILTALGVQARICAPSTDELVFQLQEAINRRPDLLIILAGDGTARAAVELCGPDGPLVAPLPGGTMNMLPHAVYGQRPWQEALALALDGGFAQTIAGGEVEGRKFLVAAILGSPALWAPAREAARNGSLSLAVRRARVALGRAFKGRLRYSFDDGLRAKAEAVVFMSPLVSKAMADTDRALEAAAMDPGGAAEAFRLGLHAVLGDWRDDPAVNVEPCRLARVWASSSIPALLDGEPVRLRSSAEVAFTPNVGRVLRLPKEG